MSGNTKFSVSGVVVLLAIALVGAFAVFERTRMLPQGSTALSWAPPSRNESNEYLDNLAGYNIHCWGDSGRYSNTIRIDDPATTYYVVSGLSPGTYQCAVSAFNAEGVQSALSNVVARTIE